MFEDDEKNSVYDPEIFEIHKVFRSGTHFLDHLDLKSSNKKMFVGKLDIIRTERSTNCECAFTLISIFPIENLVQIERIGFTLRHNNNYDNSHYRK